MDDVERGIRTKIGAGLSATWDRSGDARRAVQTLNEFVERMNRAMKYVEFFWPDAPVSVEVRDGPRDLQTIIWKAEP